LGKKVRTLTTVLLALLLLMGQIGIIAEANPRILALSESEDPVFEEMTEEERWQAEQEAAREAWFNMVPQSNEIPNWPQGPLVQAHSAIVVEVNSGAVLYAKNAHEVMYPASITKLLSLLVALQNSNFSDSVEFTEESMSMVRWDYAHIAMQVDEVISMEDALFGMMLASANEVAFAIAETVGNNVDGGGFDTFIRLMNEKSRELGTTQSNWANPTGLHHDNHYTTAYDMALIMSYLYHLPEYGIIMSAESYEIDETNIMEEVRVVWQDHQMFNSPLNNFHHPFANGGKTGFTNQAGTTLVTTANNGEFSIIVVLLYAYGIEAYLSTAALFDYAFGHFRKMYPQENALDEDVIEISNLNFSIMLPNHIDFSEIDREILLVNEGSNTGIARYLYQGQVLGEVGIVVSDDYLERLEAQRLEAERLEAERLEALEASREETESAGAAPTQGESPRSTLVNVIIIIAAILIVIVVILLALYIRGVKIARRMAEKRKRGERRF
jgi:D-alanyl-D-alanine carboxypeptidase